MQKFAVSFLSLSTRERGLKFVRLDSVGRDWLVALYERAWIEIMRHSKPAFFLHLGRSLRESVDWNHFKIISFQILHEVALYERAWIEIFFPLALSFRGMVALYERAWIEISQSSQTSSYRTSLSTRERGLKYSCSIRRIHTAVQSRSLRESVDWNSIISSSFSGVSGRSLRESVDWNSFKNILQW